MKHIKIMSEKLLKYNKGLNFENNILKQNTILLYK